MKPSTLASLQAYRGLAALLVVLYHAGNLCISHRLGDPGFSSRHGFAGVVFFFALSGFILWRVHRKDVGVPSRAPNYFRKRALRIYPAYWAVTLAMLPAWLLHPGISRDYHREFAPLVKSLLLIPQTHLPHLPVAWTLTHEALFYLMFSTLLLSRKLGTLALGAWGAAVLGAAIAQGVAGARLSFPVSFLLNEVNLLFPLGMLAAHATERFAALKEGAGVALFAAGNLLFAAALTPFDSVLTRADATWVFGAAAVLVLAGSGARPVEAFFRGRKALWFLGGASYSIYLIHEPAMLVAGKALEMAGVVGELPLWVAFPAFALVGVMAGAAMHVWVERPLLRRLGLDAPWTRPTPGR